MFYNVKLYADFSLHIIYLVLSVYGWFKWGQIKNSLPISHINKTEIVAWASVAPFATIIIGTLFAKYTQAAAPYIDSTIMVVSIIAQYLLARKILESWLLWIFVDVVGIALYAYKELYLTSGLYVVYLIICIMGYKSWKTQLQD